MNLLKFITLGSVDDGKSTLIGRLLHDSHAILTDQWATIRAQSRHTQGEEVDFSLFTDGLRAERAQGITIDIAYKYFSTPKRKFIIADAPGHFEYTRNMITGASNAQVAIILIDARHGISTQTRRHSLLISLMRFSAVIVAINKMDAVAYDASIYQNIVRDYEEMAKDLGFSLIHYLPISALKGDNIVEKSDRMSWFTGKPLLSLLESIEVQTEQNQTDSRFYVQYVIEKDDVKYYAGTVISGTYQQGDEVILLPSGIKSQIEAIVIAEKEAETASTQQAISIRLKDNVKIQRGEMISHKDCLPQQIKNVKMLICWMDEQALILEKEYILQLHSQEVIIKVEKLIYQLDIATYALIPNPENVQLNDIAKVKIHCQSHLVYDPYPTLPTNGQAILIDRETCATVAACWLYE